VFQYFKKATYSLKDYHYKISLVFVITIFCTIIEILSIGMIIPILNIFVNEDYLKYINYLFFFEDFTKKEALVIILMLFLFLYFGKFFLLRYLIYHQNSLSYKIYTDISKKVFKNYLYKDFFFHIKNNSSELIRNIQSEINLYSFGVIFPGVRLISELFIFISITITLMIFNFTTTIIILIFFILIGSYLLKTTNIKMKYWGDIRQHHSALILRQLNQSFLGIKELIINNLQEIFIKKFDYHNLQNANAGKKRDTTVQMPKLILELIGVLTFVVLIFYLLYKGKSISEIFILLGVFFFAVLRLMPGVGKIVNSIQALKFNTPVVDLVYNELLDCEKNEIYIETQKNTINNDIKNFDNLIIKNLSFSYPNSKKKILDNINIEIIKNDKIGIVGKTGEGKTTFLNILTGLIKTQEGKIIINNKDINLIKQEWQKIIGYVPQKVVIIDDSILFNITLEKDQNKVNFKKLNNILKILNLYEFIYSLPKNVYEEVGERAGEKLSGGQAQRLGIARVLYRDPEVIILDEATNFLDQITEDQILKKIFNTNNKTIISISHKNDSLRYCDKIIELKHAKIKEISFKKEKI
jgi:ABC-type multidrug transport system fused ATPase/permease subunit